MIKRQRCPICRKDLPEQGDSFPFCSQRCRQVDLLRWCDGRYAIVEQLDPDVAEFMAAEGDIPTQSEQER